MEAYARGSAPRSAGKKREHGLAVTPEGRERQHRACEWVAGRAW
jgi:hypothetical protein